MQCVTIKYEDFIGNVVPLKGSQAASGMIRFYLAGILTVIPWRTD